jgi:hypothetical protein
MVKLTGGKVGPLEPGEDDLLGRALSREFVEAGGGVFVEYDKARIGGESWL